MRKIAAILLLLIFVFNLFGYRIAISFLQKEADQKLEAVIDNNEYNDAELIEMRVALNMPYQERYTEFERHYGEITIDGKIYTYVKRKIEGDILVLKCLPNQVKQQLQETASDITKSNSSDQSDNNKKSGPTFKLFSFDCDDKNQFASLTANLLQAEKIYFDYTSPLSFRCGDIPHQPPRQA